MPVNVCSSECPWAEIYIEHLAGQLIVVCGIIIFVIPLMHRYYLLRIRFLSLHFFREVETGD